MRNDARGEKLRVVSFGRALAGASVFVFALLCACTSSTMAKDIRVEYAIGNQVELETADVEHSGNSFRIQFCSDEEYNNIPPKTWLRVRIDRIYPSLYAAKQAEREGKTDVTDEGTFFMESQRTRLHEEDEKNKQFDVLIYFFGNRAPATGYYRVTVECDRRQTQDIKKALNWTDSEKKLYTQNLQPFVGTRSQAMASLGKVAAGESDGEFRQMLDYCSDMKFLCDAMYRKYVEVKARWDWRDRPEMPDPKDPKKKIKNPDHEDWKNSPKPPMSQYNEWELKRIQELKDERKKYIYNNNPRKGQNPPGMMYMRGRCFRDSKAYVMREPFYNGYLLVNQYVAKLNSMFDQFNSQTPPKFMDDPKPIEFDNQIGEMRAETARQIPFHVMYYTIQAAEQMAKKEEDWNKNSGAFTTALERQKYHAEWQKMIDNAQACMGQKGYRGYYTKDCLEEIKALVEVLPEEKVAKTISPLPSEDFEAVNPEPKEEDPKMPGGFPGWLKGPQPTDGEEPGKPAEISPDDIERRYQAELDAMTIRADELKFLEKLMYDYEKEVKEEDEKEKKEEGEEGEEGETPEEEEDVVRPGKGFITLVDRYLQAMEDALNKFKESANPDPQIKEKEKKKAYEEGQRLLKEVFKIKKDLVKHLAIKGEMSEAQLETVKGMREKWENEYEEMMKKKEEEEKKKNGETPEDPDKKKPEEEE